MGNYRDLLVRQRARTLARAVYRATAAFPTSERYGLAAQMRRAAVSIASNIAEGAARGSDPELRRFLLIARGCAAELETQIVIAADLQILSADPARTLIDGVSETARLIQGLLRRYQRARTGSCSASPPTTKVKRPSTND